MASSSLHEPTQEPLFTRTARVMAALRRNSAICVVSICVCACWPTSIALSDRLLCLLRTVSVV